MQSTRQRLTLPYKRTRQIIIIDSAIIKRWFSRSWCSHDLHTTPPRPFTHNAQHTHTHKQTHASIQFGNARPRGVLVWQWPCRRPASRESNLRLVTTPCVQEETRLLAPTISKTVRIGYKGPSSVLYDCTLSVKLLEDRSTATLYPPSLPTVRHEDYIFGTYFGFCFYVDTRVHRAVSLTGGAGIVLLLDRCPFQSSLTVSFGLRIGVCIFVFDEYRIHVDFYGEC